MTKKIKNLDDRSPKKIDGAWISFVHWSDVEGQRWNSEIKKMTDEQWKEMVRAMHEIGMNIIVVQEVCRNEQYVRKHNKETQGYKGKAFYPSKIYPRYKDLKAEDPLEAVLSEADRLQMYVFIGVGLYAWFDFTQGSLAWHKSLVTELFNMYSHHPSFYGWYVSEETFGSLKVPGMKPKSRDKYREEIICFFQDFKCYCNKITPGKPIMLAPNCHGLTEAVDTWPRVLENLDIICPFGFHRMPKDDITGKEAVTLLKQLCNQTHSRLWMDMEIFSFRDDGALYPRPIKEITKDLRLFNNFEKILCYQFPGLMNAPWQSRKPGGQATIRLYNDYKSYIYAT